MATFPGSLVPWLPMQFTDLDGAPLAGGTVVSRVTGTNTDKDTYSDADLDISHVNTNPIQLDSSGRPESGAIFLATGGYDFFVYDALDALVYSVEGVEDVGQTFLGTLGQTFSGGVRNAADGYTFIATDFTATVLPVGSGQYNLPSAVTRGQPLTIINRSPSVTATLNVFGGVQTINGVVSTLLLPAGTSPTYSGVTLQPSASDSGWLISALWTS